MPATLSRPEGTVAETVAEARARRRAALREKWLAENPSEAQEELAQVHEQIVRDGGLWADGVPPIDFDQFFLAVNGMPLFARQRQLFHDAGLVQAVDFVTKGRRVNEVVAVFGKGAGKDLLAAAVTAYVAYINCCLAQDPSSHYGLAPYKRLSIINIAPTQKQARTVFFEYLLGFIKAPIFARFITDARRQIHADEVRFYRTTPYGAEYMCIGIYSMSSSAAGLEGHNIIWWTMDEADDFHDAADHSNADKLHGILRTSASSRFSGYWGGFVISYPRVEGGFLMRLLERAKKEPSFHWDLAASWDVNLLISRASPDIQAEYDHDPTYAAALFECRPMATSDAFFEFAERIDDAVAAGREPLCYVTTEHLDVPGENGKIGHFVMAVAGNIVPTPGHVYFLGGDGGVKGDAFALAVFHTDEATDALAYICPRCGTSENRAFASYTCQPPMTRVPHDPDIYCGVCAITSEEFFQISFAGGGIMRLDGWWVRSDVGRAGGVKIDDGRGRSYDLPHITEDLLIQIKPIKATRPGEVNRLVNLPSTQELCRRLIEGLGIQKARFDPWQTNQLTQGLFESTGRDVGEISFGGPEQYRRARLVKAMLYAGNITLLPNTLRDREWKQLQRIGTGKVNHPEPNGSKDLYDAESVAIWCAATSQCSGLEATWI